MENKIFTLKEKQEHTQKLLLDTLQSILKKYHIDEIVLVKTSLQIIVDTINKKNILVIKQKNEN